MHRYLCTIWLINSWSRHVVPVLHSFVGGSRQGPRPRTRRCAATPTGQTPAPRASHSRRARPTSVTRTGRWRGPGGAGAGTASPPPRGPRTPPTPAPTPESSDTPNKTIHALRGPGRTGPVNPSNTAPAPWTTRSARALLLQLTGSTAAPGGEEVPRRHAPRISRCDG
jgi:hypothetical protein